MDCSNDTQIGNETQYVETLILPKPFITDEFEPLGFLRIPNGPVAKEYQFRFIVFILVEISASLVYRCTGSVVAEQWVLTAAHCFTPPNVTYKNIIIVGGRANLLTYLLLRKRTPFGERIKDANGTQERRVTFWRCHPHFDEGGAPHDLALLKLEKKFNRVKPIQIFQEEVLETKSGCTAIGWGDASRRFFDGKLRYNSGLQISTTGLGCGYKKKGHFLCINFNITTLCVGDAGSPVICNNKIYGIASHYGQLQGVNLFLPRCHPRTTYYYNAIYNDKHWINTMIQNVGSIMLISRQVIFAAILLLTFYNSLQ